MEGCCAPGRESDTPPRGPEPGSAIEAAVPIASAEVPAGPFTMGTDDPGGYPGDGEGPAHRVTLPGFGISVHAVTNDLFASFVTDTAHRTSAEVAGTSFVFGGLLPDDFPPTRGVAEAPWWRQVEGASWSRPEGPRSGLDRRLDHPAVHVSWADASAYAAWAEKRLPTEVEWECAARGGLVQKRFPWGDELVPAEGHRMNVWQGTFPSHNTLDDGWLGTCPADAFPPNGFGLHNTTGNVWEWCVDAFDDERRVMRGGSYLCHESYCRRYRVAARSGNAPDSTAGNIGFRCAADC
jgi:formylglycine-generating enzyme